MVGLLGLVKGRPIPLVVVWAECVINIDVEAVETKLTEFDKVPKRMFLSLEAQ
jgi:hypothetical protein